MFRNRIESSVKLSMKKVKWSEIFIIFIMINIMQMVAIPSLLSPRYSNTQSLMILGYLWSMGLIPLAIEWPLRWIYQRLWKKSKLPIDVSAFSLYGATATVSAAIVGTIVVLNGAR